MSVAERVERHIRRTSERDLPHKKHAGRLTHKGARPDQVPFHLAIPTEANGRNGEKKDSWEEKPDTYKDAEGTWRPDSVKID